MINDDDLINFFSKNSINKTECYEYYEKLYQASMAHNDFTLSWLVHLAILFLDEDTILIDNQSKNENDKQWLAQAKEAFKFQQMKDAIFCISMVRTKNKSYYIRLAQIFKYYGLGLASLNIYVRLFKNKPTSKPVELLLVKFLAEYNSEEARYCILELLRDMPNNKIVQSLAAKNNLEPYVGVTRLNTLLNIQGNFSKMTWVNQAIADCFYDRGNKAMELNALHTLMESYSVTQGRDLAELGKKFEQYDKIEDALNAYTKAMAGKNYKFAIDPFIKCVANNRTKDKNHTNIKKLPLLLISQIQRSGGTLLSQLLDNHPQLFTHTHEIQIGSPNKWNWPVLNILDSPESWLEMLLEHRIAKFNFFGYSKADGNNAFSKNFDFNIDLTKLANIFFDLIEQNTILSQRDIISAYFTAYFKAWREYQPTGNEKYFCGFTPRLINNFNSVSQYYIDYPDGIIISSLRSPLDWYASAKKHDHEYTSIDYAINLWKVSVLSALQIIKTNPSRIYFINYEKLVENTEDQMRKLASNIEIEYNDSLLMPTYLGNPILPNSSYTINNKGVHKISRAYEILSKNEIAFIRAEALDLYEYAKSFTK